MKVEKVLDYAAYVGLASALLFVIVTPFIILL